MSSAPGAAAPFSSKTKMSPHDKAFLQFQNNLMLLEKSLEKSNEVKNKMVGILDQFEHRFSKLEQEMMEINERIDVLRLSHDNIDGTIKEIDGVLQKFGVPAQVEKRIEDGPGNDLDSYLNALDKVDHAVQFFQRHPNYKGADKISQQLGGLKQKAISKLESEFKAVIQLASKREVDPYNLSRPLKEGLDLVSEDKLDQLQKIAKRLDSMRSVVTYRKTYKEYRTKAIKKILGIIYKDKKQGLPNITNITNITNQLKTPLNLIKKEATKQKDRFYKKGSHKFIFYMDFYLKLLEGEHRMCHQIISGRDAGSIFGEIVLPSIQTFIEKAEKIAQKKDSSERVFVLFDVLENFESKLISGFDQVLGHNSSLTDKLKQVAKNIKENILQLLNEFNMRIQQNSTATFAEGLVHETTSNAFNFLKRLMEYQKTLNNWLPEFFGDKLLKEEKSLVGRYIKYVLTEFIEKNIETKSKEYKQKSLQCIFNLNNHHYIFKKLNTPEFRDNMSEGIIKIYETKVKVDEDEYISTTWSKALAFLNVENPKIIRDKKGELTKSAKLEIKKSFKGFNEAFQSIYHQQRAYCIPDIELREKVLSRTIETVSSPYTKFLKAYEKAGFTKEKNLAKYIQFPLQTLGDMLGQLFDEEAKT